MEYKQKIHCYSCKKELKIPSSIRRDKNFCDHKCYSVFKKTLWSGNNNPRWNGGIKYFSCHICSKKIERKSCGKVKNSKKQFCSLNCSNKYHSVVSREDGHWNWKGGISGERHRTQSRIEYKDWRKSVFERDNYTCQKCGKKNGNGKTTVLNAHHIERYKDNPSRRLELNNGITLCLDCHKDTHGYKKRGRIAGTP